MAVARERVVQAAERLVARGKIEAAIREYRKVLEDNPRDANTLNRVGDLYVRIERIDEAVRLYTKVAEDYTEDGFYVKAIAIYKKIIKLDPTRLEVYERLADLYHKQGLLNEARTQYLVLADYYQKHSNAASAISIYQRLVALEPDDLSHHAKLADLYRHGELIDRATEEYRLIAEMMLGHGHAEEAARVYVRALDVASADIAFITEAVLKLKEAGHPGAAARLLSEAVARNADAARVARMVGLDEPPKRPAAAAAEPPAPRAKRAAPAPAAPRETEEAEEEEKPAAPAGSGEVSFEEVVLEDGRNLAEAEFLPDDDVVILEDEDEAASEEAPAAAAAASPPSAEAAEADEAAEASAEEAEASAVLDWQAAAEEELEVDFGEAFILDLDDDEVPSSLVQPPPDMLEPGAGAAPESAFARPGSTPAASSAPSAPSSRLPAPAPEEAQEELEISLAGIGEDLIDLDQDLSVADLAPAEAPAGPQRAAATPSGIEIDPDLLERTAAEVERPQVRREEDLISEAEVFAKYGLTEKATEALREALRLDPKNLEAHGLLVHLQLEGGHHARALQLAREMRELAAERGGDRFWDATRQRLRKAGFRFDGDRPVEAPRSAEAQGEERINRLLHGLLEEEPAAPKPAPPRRRGGGRLAEAVDEIASKVLRRERPAAAAPAPAGMPASPAASSPPAAPPASGEIVDIGGAILEELSLEEGFAEASLAPPRVDVPPPPAAAGQGGDHLDDTGMSWLDEVRPAAAGGPAARRSGQKLFAAEDEFFDLAAELEQELKQDGSFRDEDLLVQPREQSLEEIVEGFKKGVSEHLSSEDYDTHFNLGIAYREMGLLDEAIGEFQLAAKDSTYLVSCCSMLGMCFLEKGLPELAVKWYGRGLEAPNLSEEDGLGLLYDMGNVYLSTGDRDSARKTFVELYGINTNYRDVVAKLEELNH